MGFVMGGSCFLCSPLHHSLFFSNNHAAPCSSTPLLTPFFSRNAHKQRRVRTTMACMHQEKSTDANFCRRKAIVFMGVAALPLLSMRARAAEGEVVDSGQQRTQANASSNLFFSLLNGLGIIGAGVLAALYALAQKEKAASDAMLESVKSKLKGKDDTILSIEKKFESELLNEKEIRSKQLKEANAEKQSLVDQLTSANGTVTKLGQELQKERKLAEELKSQIDGLQTNLIKMEEDKLELQGELKEKLNSLEVFRDRIELLSSKIRSKEDDLEKVSTTLAEKKKELSDLSSKYQQSQDQVRALESGMKDLKDELEKYRMEVEQKNIAVDNLNARVTSLLAEREEVNKKLDAIQIQYDDLKKTSAEKEASDAKLLGEQQQNVNQLEKQLKIAKKEDLENQKLIDALTCEREEYSRLVDLERKKAQIMEEELQRKDASLEESNLKASDLDKQLQKSKDSCSELELTLSKVKAEFAEERESLQRSLDEARQSEKNLGDELEKVKEFLKLKTEEVQTLLKDRATAEEQNNSLQKEILGAYDEKENAIHALKEEKDKVASLKTEKQKLESQILKDKEARESLEVDLDEATRSLDEMNQNVLTLSRDLELATSRISSLEDEKDVLQRTLVEQKQVSQEARENLEDAHNLVMRLGKERESLEKKAEKLEEELASAKGEILRLRSQINSSRTPVNNQHQQNVGASDEDAVPLKRTARRRKVSPPRENP